MSLGHREHPSRRLPVIADLRLSRITMHVEKLARERQYGELRAFLYDLERGAVE